MLSRWLAALATLLVAGCLGGGTTTNIDVHDSSIVIPTARIAVDFREPPGPPSHIHTGHAVELEIGPADGSRVRPSPWLVVLLVLACCCVGVTAGGQPAPPARLVFAASGVVEPAQVVGDAVLASVGGQITSYDVASGAVRWQYDPPRRTQTLATDDTVVVAPVSCSSRSPFQTLGLDARTGAERWNVRGAPIWLVDGAPIVVMKQPIRGCSEATLGFDPMPSAPFSSSFIASPTSAAASGAPAALAARTGEGFRKCAAGPRHYQSQPGLSGERPEDERHRDSRGGGYHLGKRDCC